jgi:AraC family transcriptional regulator
VNQTTPQTTSKPPAFETRIDVSVSTSVLVAQLVTHLSPGPADFILDERVHTLSMQRQVQQSLSVGRFETRDAPGEFHDIGRAIFVPAGVPLRIRSDGMVTNTIRCFFRPPALEDLLGEEIDQSRNRLNSCLNIRRPAIRDLLLRIAREIETPGFASARLLDALGETLLVELVRYLRETPADGNLRGGLSRAAYRKVIRRLEEEGAPPTLEELATLAELSRRHLTRAFHETTGMTIHQQLDELRFKRATTLLDDPALPIAEIAKRLGFLSGSAFSTAFTRWSGKSPSRYRNELAQLRPARGG